MTIFVWGEKLGKPECPYLIRWVINLVVTSFRLHWWRFGDDPRAKHNHQWAFATLVLWGGYTDRYLDPEDINGPEKTDRLTAGSIRFRPAKWIHTVDVDKGGCLTFMITGPVVSPKWGFFTKRADGSLRFTKSNKFFIENGHHPCQ